MLRFRDDSVSGSVLGLQLDGGVALSTVQFFAKKRSISKGRFWCSMK